MLTLLSARNPCNPSHKCSVQSLAQHRIQPVSAVPRVGSILLRWEMLLHVLRVPAPPLLLVQGSIALHVTSPKGRELAVAIESLLCFGRVTHVDVDLGGSCFHSVTTFSLP